MTQLASPVLRVSVLKLASANRRFSCARSRCSPRLRVRATVAPYRSRILRRRQMGRCVSDLRVKTRHVSKNDTGTSLPQPSLGGLRQHISLYLHALRNTPHKEVHTARLLLHPSASAFIQFQLRQDSRTIGRLAPRDSPGVHTRLPRDHGTPPMERRPPNMATVRPTVAVFL